MGGSVDSVRILGEAIELAEMLEILAQNQVVGGKSNQAGEFPVAGVRLTLRQITEQMRTVRADLLSKSKIVTSPEVQKVSESIARNGSSLASRLKPAPTFSGRVRDISIGGGASIVSGDHGAQ